MTRSKMKAMPQALLAALVVTPLAFAQQTPPPAAQKVEKIEVTGTNIKRIDSETTAPVQIITRDEIERSGKQTITEVLRTLPINSTGGLNDITSANSFSSGASTVSLRGLGSAATLVLLNGRRIAPFGNADPNFGQSAVVNLDALPLDVIERIEILKDGASAIYGSEAVAGVVNIILRKDFRGAIIGGNYSINDESEYRVARASTTLGYGDLGRDRYNFFVNYERFQRERVTVDEVENYIVRPELRNSNTFQTFRRFTSSFAGNYLNGVFNTATGQATAISFRPAAQQPANCVPGAIKISGICRWDIPAKQDIVPQSDRDNFYARGAIDFSATTQGYAELGFNRTKTSFRANPQVYGDFGSWYSSTQQRLVNLPEFLPANHPNNPFGAPVIYRHRFVEVGDTNREVTAEALRFVAGVKGVAGPIDWEAGILHSENETEVINKNQIRFSVLRNAILNGTYNFFSPTSGAVKPDDLRINTVDVADSQMQIADLKGSMEIAQLSAGPVTAAAGLEFRREERNANPDPNKLTGEVVGFGAAFAQGKRNIRSVFTEVNVPVSTTLEAQLAFRSDRYSDYGSSTTPKVGLKWKATPTFAVRGSYAEGFRAPSLTEISRSSVTAFTTVLDPRRCVDGTELACSGTSVALLLENANRLEPEVSDSRHVGLVWEPLKELSVTFDRFDIRRRQEINILDLDLILANEGATTGVYANRVIRGPVLPGEQFGPIQAISTFFFNSGKTEIKGYDLEGRYRHSFGEMGRVTFAAAATYLKSVRGNSVDTEPVLEFVTYGAPRTRARGELTWEYRDYTFGTAVNYNSGYNVLRDPTLTCSAAIRAVQPDCYVDPSTTTDVSVRWTGIKNLTLSMIVRNVANRKPVLDANARPLNYTFHPFQGQYMTVAATYRFK